MQATNVSHPIYVPLRSGLGSQIVLLKEEHWPDKEKKVQVIDVEEIRC